MATIQRADPEARRKALRILAMALLLGLAAIAVIEHYRHDIESWLGQNLGLFLEHPWLVFIATLPMGLPVIAAGTYLLVFARHIVRARRFPPPGCAVTRDTAVLEGGRAVRRARIIQLLALLIIFAALAFPVYLWRLLSCHATAA
jgi:hypothetical protein